MVIRHPVAQIFLLILVFSCLSVVGLGQERDILDVVAKRPLGHLVQNTDGRWRTPKYGDYRLEQAMESLKSRSRPFTIPRVMKWYYKEKNAKSRSALLRLLAASRDTRAAVVLGNAIADDSFDVRIAAIDGLQDYFIVTVVGGGTEQQINYVLEWWRKNRVRLEAEAKALEKHG